IAVIQHLYGANDSFNKGDDVYRFGPDNPSFQTIWDAGGNDTISIADVEIDSVINLNEGEFSQVGFAGAYGNSKPDAKTLGIAFGAVIENAVGGRGNDTLIGNSSDNVLTGGDGHDTVVFS